MVNLVVGVPDAAYGEHLGLYDNEKRKVHTMYPSNLKININYFYK